MQLRIRTGDLRSAKVAILFHNTMLTFLLKKINRLDKAQQLT